MSFIGDIFHSDSNTKLAASKQNAVFALWKWQSEAEEILNRALSENCKDEKFVKSKIQQLNSIRQAIQDKFLLLDALPNVQHEIDIAKREFKIELKKCIDEIIVLERSMDTAKRIDNIDISFRHKFREANQQNKISEKTLVHLNNQSKMFKRSLQESIENSLIRSNIKTNLLHELIDDYYNQINQIYNEVIHHK